MFDGSNTPHIVFSTSYSHGGFFISMCFLLVSVSLFSYFASPGYFLLDGAPEGFGRARRAFLGVFDLKGKSVEPEDLRAVTRMD